MKTLTIALLSILFADLVRRVGFPAEWYLGYLLASVGAVALVSTVYPDDFKRPAWLIAGRPALIGINLFAAWMWLPFIGNILQIDHDAMAILSHVRETGEFTGWRGGFYGITLMTGAYNSLLNATGWGHDDYLLAYKLLVLTSAFGVVNIVYALARRILQNPVLPIVIPLILIALPGFINLLSRFEDNIVVSFFHLVYVALFCGFALGAKQLSYEDIRLRPDLYLTPVALCAALCLHRQLGVLLATPVLFYFMLPQINPRQRLLLIATQYAITVGLFVAITAIMTAAWTGNFSVALLLEGVKEWFVPNQYYQGYYFFAQFGWDLPRQAVEIYLGVTQLVTETPDRALIALVLWITPMIALGMLIWRRRLPLPFIGKVLLLFTALHIPHSLIYESSNVERWDCMVPTLLLLIGVMLDQAIHLSTPSEYRFGKTPALPVALLLLAFCYLTVFNIHSRQARLTNMTRYQSDPERVLIIAKLLTPTLAENREHNFTVLMNKHEFKAHSMAAHMYYAYSRDVFGFGPNDELLRSTHMYHFPRPTHPSALRARLRRPNALLVATKNNINDLDWHGAINIYLIPESEKD